jgi:F-type H+-transporting ATPase subunit epsilon
MPTTKLEIVTAERQVFSEDVNTIIAEGIDGQMTILPKHAPLITMLAPGELVIRKDGEEMYMSISGGFLEVRPDKVIVLADACERSQGSQKESRGKAEEPDHRGRSEQGRGSFETVFGPTACC